jgi:hypothetical protein
MKKVFSLFILFSLLTVSPLCAIGQKKADEVTPEPVVVAPATPAAVVVDMRDGFWCQSLKTLDLDGEQRTFTLIYFPKRYLTGPDTWTAGIREALVHFYGCETFKDCTPELWIGHYKRVFEVPVLTARLDAFDRIFIFPLVTAPSSHLAIGIALID